MILYRAAWVVPITSPPVRDGAVGVDEEGRIAFVGPADRAPLGDARDLGETILLPGLVNAHTHLELTGMRGFLEDMPFFDWISTLTRARRAVLNEEDLRDAARLGVLEGLSKGITTFADTCSSGVALGVMRALGARGVMYLEVFGPDPAQRDDSLRDLHARLVPLREVETDLVRLGVSPHAPYSVSAELFAAVADLARATGLPVAIHAAESEAESHFIRSASGPWADSHDRRGIAVKAQGLSPIAFLDRTGILGASPLLIHCVQVDEGDIRLIAGRGCAVAHCPVSNAKLRHGVAPLPLFIDAGVRVGLGSDSMASNNRMDLLEEARTAILAQHLRNGQLDAQRAVELATLGGASAIGLGDRIGSLEVGKDADLAAFPCAGFACVPLFDPVQALVWSIAGASATLVTVRGRERVRDGRLLEETDGVRTRVRESADRLVRWRAAQR